MPRNKPSPAYYIICAIMILLCCVLGVGAQEALRGVISCAVFHSEGGCPGFPIPLGYEANTEEPLFFVEATGYSFEGLDWKKIFREYLQKHKGEYTCEDIGLYHAWEDVSLEQGFGVRCLVMGCTENHNLVCKNCPANTGI